MQLDIKSSNIKNQQKVDSILHNLPTLTIDERIEGYFFLFNSGFFSRFSETLSENSDLYYSSYSSEPSDTNNNSEYKKKKDQLNQKLDEVWNLWENIFSPSVKDSHDRKDDEIEDLISILDALKKRKINSLTNIFSSFVLAAVKSREPEFVFKLWDICRKSKLYFTTKDFERLAEAVYLLNSEKLLKHIWTYQKNSGVYLNTDSVINFAKTAVSADAVDIFDEIVEKWLDSRLAKGFHLWNFFLENIIKLNRDGILPKLWQESERHNRRSQKYILIDFIDATGALKRDDLFEQFWLDFMNSNQEFDDDILNSFLKAAGDLSRGDLLKIIWKSANDRNFSLSASNWSTVARAAGDASCGDFLILLSNLYNTSIGSGRAYISEFALSAGLTNQRDFLKEIWVERKNLGGKFDLESRENYYNAAKRLNVQEIIDELEIAFDKPDCWDVNWKSKVSNIGRVIKPKKYSQIRSLGNKYETWTWLVKKFFEMSKEDFRSFLSNHISEIELPKTTFGLAWYYIVSETMESYARQLRQYILDDYHNSFSFLDDLDDENFLKTLEKGEISLQIKNFQNDVIKIMTPRISNSSNKNSSVAKILPALDYTVTHHGNFLKNRQDYYEFRKNAEVMNDFHFKVSELLTQAQPNKFVNDDWMDLIELLLGRVSTEISDIFLNLLSGEVHSFKRIFREKFENNINQKTFCPSELNILVKHARKFLKNFINHLPSYRLNEPASVDIIPFIKIHLLRENNAGDNLDVLLPNQLNIAGYNGIYEDYLKPMFIEIRSNAEKALSDIPENKQNHQVILKRGENGYSGYGILSVINNFIEKEKSTSTDPISTGTGLKNIQYYASFFQLDNRQGWAQFMPKKSNGHKLFEVQIYFPIWESSEKENLSYA